MEKGLPLGSNIFLDYCSFFSIISLISVSLFECGVQEYLKDDFGLL